MMFKYYARIFKEDGEIFDPFYPASCVIYSTSQALYKW